MRSSLSLLSFPIVSLFFPLSGCNTAASEQSFDYARCDALRAAMSGAACRAVTHEGLIELTYAACTRRIERGLGSCEKAFDLAYDCLARAVADCTSDAAGSACASEAAAYAACESQSACSDFGGGVVSFSDENAARVATLDISESCACSEHPWNAGASGASCGDWVECTPTCCTCPGSTYAYSAAACDFSASKAGGNGVCADATRACALTAERCQR